MLCSRNIDRKPWDYVDESNLIFQIPILNKTWILIKLRILKYSFIFLNILFNYKPQNKVSFDEF